MSLYRQILEFLDVPVAGAWDMEPEQALAFFRAKGLRTTFRWQDMVGTEHARAFTVAKMMDADLLATVQKSLDEALASGMTYRAWADKLTPTLQAAGWWGRKQVMGPDGSVVVASLGSPKRLETIYRANMQSAYAAGQWDDIVAQSDLAPYLLYDAVDDHRVRAEHAAWDGIVLPITDVWWKTHYPPNGWNCRCTVIQLSDDDLADLGLSVTPKPPTGTYSWTNPVTGKTQRIPNGVDPGWNTNVGEARSQALAKAQADKVAGYPEPLQAPAARGLAKAHDAGVEAMQQASQAAIDDVAELSAEQLARQATKQANRAAANAIQSALEANTPYLAKAIQQVTKTKAGAAMAPAQVLEAAKVQAAKTESSAALAHWKQAHAAGKSPSIKAQAAFDALPTEAQVAMKAQADAARAEALAQKAAQVELDAIAAKSAGTLEAKALKAVLGEGDGMKPTELLAAVQQNVASAKALQVQAQVQSGLKKALVADKVPTAAQQAALDAMTPDAKAAFLADVDLAKQSALKAVTPAATVAPAEAMTAAQTLNPSTLVQIGPQRGSNPGGLYRDTETGQTWYIKTPPSLAHAQNEVLAGKLYQAAGVNVPELRLTTLNGQPAVASRIVDDLAKLGPDDLAKAQGVREGFVADAWLGNWDVVGATFDNLLVRGGVAYRVDTGGALLFRAQGAAKGASFGDNVAELKTLLDAAKNPNTARVFGGMTQQQLEASAKAVLAISDDTIRLLVKQHGPAGELGETLAARLIARKAHLAKEFGQATEAFAQAKALAIEAAEFAAREGLETVNAAYVQAIKGIATRSSTGAALEAKDFDRAIQARRAYMAWIDEHNGVLADATVVELEQFYGAWSDTLLEALKPGLGKPGAWKGEQFAGFGGRLVINEGAVPVILPPAGMRFSPTQAKKVISDALGKSAASLDVPDNGGATALKAALPLEHQRAVAAYTGSYYRTVNEALRAGKASPAQMLYADLVNEALTLAPKYVGEVTRGVSLSGDALTQFLAAHRQAMVTGQGVTHSGFISTTKGAKSAFSGNVVLHIQSRSGVWVRPISMHASENEVLLGHGSRFTVTDLKESGGVHHVYLEEVGP